MRRRSEIIGNALNLTACWAYTRCPRASIHVRVKRIVVVAILLSPAIAIPAMAADMPLPGPAPIPPNSYYPVAAPLSWGASISGSTAATASATVIEPTQGFDGQLRHHRGSRWGDSRFSITQDLAASCSAWRAILIGPAAGQQLHRSMCRSGCRRRFGTAGAALADLRVGLNPQATFATLGPQVAGLLAVALSLPSPRTGPPRLNTSTSVSAPSRARPGRSARWSIQRKSVTPRSH